MPGIAAMPILLLASSSLVVAPAWAELAPAVVGECSADDAERCSALDLMTPPREAPMTSTTLPPATMKGGAGGVRRAFRVVVFLALTCAIMKHLIGLVHGARGALSGTTGSLPPALGRQDGVASGVGVRTPREAALGAAVGMERERPKPHDSM
mmetsp:Transcript_76883/g.222210  ORF Transcript_76883/g.222210 Transcript_76883/m.222210 type:complete len:153 (-) Transcript_76883:68-526(-)